MSSLQENVRNHRRRTGMSHEQLAEAADLSVGVVRKVEKGGNVQVETLHMLARALGTTTSSLFATEAPEPIRLNEGDGPKLMELRRALMPPVGLSEVLVEPERATPLSTIQRDIGDSHALYHADRYDSVAKRLPGILTAAEAAVVFAEDGEPRQQAVMVRARAPSCSPGST
ncbi:MAG TPA: helix-turn-helix transcriptional regulator [Streptomyces sp.]|nr:helix-turn-helix transcriptional regulator [Streptomyces sp.]